jgi:hypothetical protein
VDGQPHPITAAPKKPVSSGVRCPRATSRSSEGASGGALDSWRVTTRSRRDAGRIDREHLVSVSQEVAELTREQLHLVRLELELRKRGNCGDLRGGEFCGHGKC